MSEEKTEVDHKEAISQPVGRTPAEIQAEFPTLRDLTEDEMRDLNRAVVRKIDWRMMPCITLMFLMKLVLAGLRSMEQTC